MPQREVIRSWRGALPILATALVAVVGVGGPGQASQVAHSKVRDQNYPPPYNSSAADQSLRLFDQKHPECVLWTDWHKLCSRTGPNSSTYCRTDPTHTAKPSTPFCVRGSASNLITDQLIKSRAELKSLFRFSHLVFGDDCDKHSRRSCDSRPYRIWADSRPFSGRTIAQMEHPACVVWRMHDQDDSEQLCAEDGRSDMHSCKENIFRRHIQSISYECAEFSLKNLCPSFHGERVGQKINTDKIGTNYNSAGGGFFGSVALLNRIPAWGYYCPKEER